MIRLRSSSESACPLEPDPPLTSTGGASVAMVRFALLSSLDMSRDEDSPIVLWMAADGRREDSLTRSSSRLKKADQLEVGRAHLKRGGTPAEKWL